MYAPFGEKDNKVILIGYFSKIAFGAISQVLAKRQSTSP
jgi:hypothetical protein